MGSDMDMADVPLEEADAIVNVSMGTRERVQSNAIYDLSGRRSYGTGRGIYIKGGKKYVVY